MDKIYEKLDSYPEPKELEGTLDDHETQLNTQVAKAYQDAQQMNKLMKNLSNV